MAIMNQEPKDEWAIVQLMGHVRIVGRVSEVKRFGVTLGRVEIPDTSDGAEPGTFIRHEDFGGSAVYRITPCTEEEARSMVRGWRPGDADPLLLPSPSDRRSREVEPCEDCGLGVEIDPTLAGPVLCAGCAENREHAREIEMREESESAFSSAPLDPYAEGEANG